VKTPLVPIPEPTEAQIAYVRSLQRQLHLPDRMLDDHTVRTFGKKFSALNRNQVSQLLDELIDWQDLPADMKRAMGQQDLFPEGV
jgi:hypothetical protein